MGRDEVLMRGRERAELGMRDTCTIRRATGTTTDDFSGQTTTTYDVVYTGKCRIKQAQALPETHDAGEDYVVLSRLELQLPMAVTGVQVEDEVTIDSSVRDPDLPGSVFLIGGPAKGTDLTARRLEIRERVG